MQGILRNTQLRGAGDHTFPIYSTAGALLIECCFGFGANPQSEVFVRWVRRYGTEFKKSSTEAVDLHDVLLRLKDHVLVVAGVYSYLCESM